MRAIITPTTINAPARNVIRPPTGAELPSKNGVNIKSFFIFFLILLSMLNHLLLLQNNYLQP